MEYKSTLNSQEFYLLVSRVKAMAKKLYEEETGKTFNWNRISRLPSYKARTLKYSLVYFLVRHSEVFDALIEHFVQEEHEALIEEVNKQEGKIKPTPEILAILEGPDCLSSSYLNRKFAAYGREKYPAPTITIKEPYSFIFPIFCRDIAPLIEKPQVSNTPDHILNFEVLYNSTKVQEIKTFDLVFDFQKKKAVVKRFHDNSNKKYEGDFELEKGKLNLNLKREDTDEVLHLVINIGNHDIRTANYFSGIFVGTSFSTNKAIYGPFYLLREELLKDSRMDRRAYRLKLQQKLNLQAKSNSIGVIDFLESNIQEHKNELEVLEDYIGTYYACHKIDDHHMMVAIFHLKEDFIGKYHHPKLRRKNGYTCNISISEAFKTQQALAIEVTFNMPKDPFLFALINIPAENEAHDFNKLKGSFCSLIKSKSDNGQLVLHRVLEGFEPTPAIVDMRKNKTTVFIDIWDMLQESEK